MAIGRSGGALDGLMGKLGFGSSQSYDDGYLDPYDEYGAGYDDYEDAQPAGSYDRYDTVSTREPGRRSQSSAYAGGSQAGSSGSSRRGTTYPPLINIDDVKASTKLPDSLSRDPLPPRRRASSLGRNSVGRASDYALSGSEIEEGLGNVDRSQASRDEGRTSRGYNSLFDPSASRTSASDAPKPASKVGQGTHEASASYDPYQVYEGASDARRGPSRKVSIIAPTDYSEVESVARSLKAGDAVVITLRNTQSALSKRILDFSFGVASALDASVDCIADKVFAITRTRALAEDELASLRSKGVL